MLGPQDGGCGSTRIEVCLIIVLVDDPCAREALDLMVAALRLLDQSGNDIVAVHLDHAIQMLQDVSSLEAEG